MAAPSSGGAPAAARAGGPAARSSRAPWIVTAVTRVAGLCRVQARLVGAGAAGVTRAAATAARSGGRQAARADAAPSVR